MFGGQEIWKGIKDKEIEATYERLMSPLDNLFEMSLFFIVIQIRVVKDMDCSNKFGSKHMRTRGNFTFRHKEIYLMSRGHRHGMDKHALGCASSSNCFN
jgi:hypothetical protein